MSKKNVIVIAVKWPCVRVVFTSASGVRSARLLPLPVYHFIAMRLACAVATNN